MWTLLQLLFDLVRIVCSHVTADNEHSDLFRALPWSHGTLGLLVAVELRVVPAAEYVLMEYIPFYSLEDYQKAYTEVLHSEEPPFFLEMIIFSKQTAVLMKGSLVKEEDLQSYKDLKVNKMGEANAPWFYKHVETFVESGVGKEIVPIYDYLMRHDRSMCMTMGTIIPFGNEPWFRNTLGFMTPPNVAMMKSMRRAEDRERSIREQVWQDTAFPAEDLEEMVNKSHDLFEIYPLLCYPCKVFDNGGFIRLRDGDNNKREYDGTSTHRMYLNLGIYGIPKATREGKKFKTLHAVREFEGSISAKGGFQHTYCDSFMTEEEFMEMFDHTLWKQMREKYKCEGSFPTVYQKTRPEVDFKKWIAEEATWTPSGENPYVCE